MGDSYCFARIVSLNELYGLVRVLASYCVDLLCIVYGDVHWFFVHEMCIINYL